ncbi:YhbD family protein [Bacillus sp. S/N-304-OC-R1]|uniref:YhbD family protein n=1 Tax=Bacillus sp. S/N-304-OC-R1 TaxID=2758034 RepID=UPI001C8E33D9|nr:YhbD family protein [Bacillus sp. S/N-304-OC-R1]MBY0120344.1 YhbD family protein [Bacillus sp. S/N-304-OC-R1]
MNTDLISKKDLLDLTDISYGQLYRWKRKRLIPDEWFIRKSTFTGQETFFPKEKILDRIEKIKAMKDNISLDELADLLSPTLGNVQLSQEELSIRNIVAPNILDFYLQQKGIIKFFTFENLLQVYILEKLLQAGEINLDEGKMIIQVLTDFSDKMNQKTCKLFFIRKLGVSSCFVVCNPEGVFFEKGTKIIFQLSLQTCIEELKEKLNS